MTAQARTNVLCDVKGTAIVRISKTGTGRFVGYSPTAARALDRCRRGPGPGGIGSPRAGSCSSGRVART